MKFNDETLIDFIDKVNTEESGINLANDTQARNNALAEFYKEGSQKKMKNEKMESETGSINYIIDHEFGNIIIDPSVLVEKSAAKVEISAALKYMRSMQWNEITLESNKIIFEDIFSGGNIFLKIMNKIKGAQQKHIHHSLADN